MRTPKFAYGTVITFLSLTANQLAAGPVYTATILAQSSTTLDGATISSNGIGNAAISQNGNIVFNTADTNHVFTDIAGTLSLADPLGSGGNIQYSGGPVAINNGGQFLYVGTPNGQTISYRLYQGSTVIANSVNPNAVVGLGNDGTILYRTQVPYGSLFTPSGEVVSGASRGTIDNADTIFWSPFAGGAPPYEVDSAAGLVVGAGTVLAGASITNLDVADYAYSNPSDCGYQSQACFAMGSNGDYAVFANYSGGAGILSSTGTVIQLQAHQTVEGLAIDSDGLIGWFDWSNNGDSLNTQYGTVLESGDVLDGKTVAGVSTPDFYNGNFIDENGDMIANVGFTDGSSALVELTNTAAPEPGPASYMFIASGIASIWRRRHTR